MSSTLYLLGSPTTDLFGPTLPSNAEMLRYYHHLRDIHTVHYSIRRAVSRCYEIWEKVGLPTSPMSLAIDQMQRLVDEYRRIEKRNRRGKVVKVRRFRKELRVMFFVGREDVMERCDGEAKKLLVEALMVALGMEEEEEECEAEFEALDNKATLKLKPELDDDNNNNNNNNNNHIDKKCEYWNWLYHDENQWKMDLEPNDKDRDFFNSIGDYKVKPKIKTEPAVSKQVYSWLADNEKQLEMDIEPSNKHKHDFWNFLDNNNKVQSKITPSNIDLADDEIRMKMGPESIDKKKNPEYWNCFDIQPKMKIEPCITYNDDDYAAYMFEEEWNLRYPKYDENSMSFPFVSVN